MHNPRTDDGYVIGNTDIATYEISTRDCRGSKKGGVCNYKWDNRSVTNVEKMLQTCSKGNLKMFAMFVQRHYSLDLA